MKKKCNICFGCLTLFVSLNHFAVCQDSNFVFPDENNICVNLIFDYSEVNKKFIFEYELQSLDCSAQPIWEFRIEQKLEEINAISPQYWTHSYSKLYYNTISWGASDSSNFINKNEKTKGFKLKFKGLPGICKFFVSGYTPIPVFNVGEEPMNVQNNDIFKSSYSGFTVGPQSFPQKFDTKIFIKKLRTYSDSSFSLNWIRGKEINNKYDSLFSEAKYGLEFGDTNKTHFNLFRVLKNVDIDSSFNITSEAYALLRFNTEYVLKKLLPIDPINLFDIIIGYVNECIKKRGLGKKGYYKSLMKKINNAAEKYEKGEKKSSINLIRAFQNELKAQRNKHISDKCYHLLYDYADFIIYQIK